MSALPLRAPMTRLPKARACGNCTCCCTRLAVDEIGKPAKHRCEHLREGGCRVYAVRPGSCAEYRCLWLTGSAALPLAAHRPDRLGLMFDQAAEPHVALRLTQAAGDRWLIARELWPGAAGVGEAARVLESLATQGLILMDFWDGRPTGNLRGPRDLVRRAQAAAGESV